MNKKDFKRDFKKGDICLIRCRNGTEFFSTDYFFVGRQLNLVVDGIVKEPEGRVIKRLVIGSIDIGDVNEVI